MASPSCHLLCPGPLVTWARPNLFLVIAFLLIGSGHLSHWQDHQTPRMHSHRPCPPPDHPGTVPLPLELKPGWLLSSPRVVLEPLRPQLGPSRGTSPCSSQGQALVPAQLPACLLCLAEERPRAGGHKLPGSGGIFSGRWRGVGDAKFAVMDGGVCGMGAVTHKLQGSFEANKFGSEVLMTTQGTVNLAGPTAWNSAAQVLKMICAGASLNRSGRVV